jgi:hypothetical protein
VNSAFEIHTNHLKKRVYRGVATCVGIINKVQDQFVTCLRETIRIYGVNIPAYSSVQAQDPSSICQSLGLRESLRLLLQNGAGILCHQTLNLSLI